jgi:hypothetical protein
MSLDNKRRRQDGKKAWDGGKPPPPRQLGNWTFTLTNQGRMQPPEIGEALVAQTYRGVVKVYRVMTPVLESSAGQLFHTVDCNCGIANAKVIKTDGRFFELELT